MSRRRDWLALSLLLLIATYFLWSLVQDGWTGDRPRSHDTYAYFYPIMIQTARAIWNGGRGLFWNTYQNCGQPLFGVGHTGILYPPGVLSLILSPDHALWSLIFFNLAAASIGAYFLGRELGVSRLAAWCGAVTFTFSTSSIDVLTYTPLVSCPYAWFPSAMLFCERILREPRLRWAVALGATLSLSLIMGHQQVPFYLYQLIGMRVLWEIITRGRTLAPRALALVATGMVIGPLLSAIQLIPAVEVMRLSIRNTALKGSELQPYPFLDWEKMRAAFALRSAIFNPFMLLPLILAGAALLRTAGRRLVLFYVVIGLLTFDLAMGPNGWLFPYYAELPLGRLFRDPGRFLWVSSFCIALLVAFAVDALTSRAPAPWRWRIAAMALTALSAVGVYHLAPNHWRPHEWSLVIAGLTGTTLAVLVPRARLPAALLLAAALAIDLVYYHPAIYRNLMPGDRMLTRAPLFHQLRERMSDQDRAYLVLPGLDYSLLQKTGTLFEVPTIFDYDSVPTLRYASFFTMMRTGRELDTVNLWIYPMSGFLPPGFKRPLLNLTAARYLIVAKAADRTHTLQPPVVPVFRADDVTVYENTAALPRVFYVPSVAVVPDPTVLLNRLANGADDLRKIALIEEDFPSGFRGDPATSGDAIVTLTRNEPERINLRVQAPARGFVFLADQFYPGWSARVNGVPAPIVRANYAFRLVEVGPGLSSIKLRYRPASVRIGLVVSLLTVIGLALLRLRRPAAW